MHQQVWSTKKPCYSDALGFFQRSALFSTRFSTSIKFNSRWNSMACHKVIQEANPTIWQICEFPWPEELLKKI